MRDEEFLRLAAFRTQLRQFQAFSERACETEGLTSPQYQALLAMRAHRGDEAPFTMRTLSECLLIKHNSAVGLVDRMAQLGLVERTGSPTDRRSVVLVLTAHGGRIIDMLAEQHRAELHRTARAWIHCMEQLAQPPAAS